MANYGKTFRLQEEKCVNKPEKNILLRHTKLLSGLDNVFSKLDNLFSWLENSFKRRGKDLYMPNVNVFCTGTRILYPYMKKRLYIQNKKKTWDY